MDELQIKQAVKKYIHLNRRKTELEQELALLRAELIAECNKQQTEELNIKSHRIRLIMQERKEYDDLKLYNTLNDAELWRLVSKADNAKINALLKSNVLSETLLQDTYSTKQVTILKVEQL